ncbi:MAG: fibronectin type III domain-containing protein [Muribaculaceae bacterium]|nr:fibronectin type III domain-containing protein [Muribaculaceae bacterium]
MKIKHLLLWLLLALCMPWTAKAQTAIPYALTVNDGDSYTNSMVPIASAYVQNGYAQSQFILLNEDLADMIGGTVTKLTFYCNNSGNYGNARFSVYVAEVSENGFTNYVYSSWDWNSMSLVYTGPLDIVDYEVNNYKVEIQLTSPFTYYGGNLKIGFQEITNTGSKVSPLSWRGVKDANAHPAVYCYRDTWLTIHNDYTSIRPRVTFDYYVLDLPMVDVDIDTITQSTASFSWDAPSSDVTGYKYQYNRASEGFVDSWAELPSTATSLTLENLASATDYVFRMKACYGEHESVVTTLDFKTACPDYASIPYYENFDSYEVEDHWTPDEHMLPDCWDYINASDDIFPSMHYSTFNPLFAYSSPNSLLFYIDNSNQNSTPQYVILPAMHNINGLRVKLYARAYNSSSSMFSGAMCRVGVMEETEKGPEFIQIGDSIKPDSYYQLYVRDFTSYTGNGEHIAIWMEVPHLYGKIFIDDIVVEEIPNFTKPIASYGGNAGGWYLISSPLNDIIHPENMPQFTNADNPGFDLFRFNPSPQNPGYYWENWKSHANNDDHYHFHLEPGRGYLYANINDVSLDFTGTPYSGNGEVTLHYNENERWGSWNLVGNPFPYSAYIGDRYFLRMNEEGTGFVPATVGSAIEAMEGIFVYTEDDGEILTFSTTQPTRSNEQLSLNVSKITRGGLNTTIDRAILNFGEGNRLPKFQLKEESTKVYIPQNGLDYAVVTAEGQGEMPVNFRVDENDTYTLSFNCENVEFSYLHLFDNKTGTDVDLLSTPSYTFNATTTDYESRFKLVYATGSSVDGDSFSFFNSNGNFSIFGIEGQATLQVFDMMGRMLSTETFNGSIEKRLDVAPGVYFIRLVNGDDVRTQKIIVR